LEVTIHEDLKHQEVKAIVIHLLNNQSKTEKIGPRILSERTMLKVNFPLGRK
jgi:hypothetical protein